MRNYTELSRLETFDERFNYLKLQGAVGQETFGYARYLNQLLYKSPHWFRTRREVIIRDDGLDLGVDGYFIGRGQKIVCHHMNPITEEQIINRDPMVFDPEYIICTTIDTHNAIHYGDISYLDSKKLVLRAPNDTCPWR